MFLVRVLLYVSMQQKHHGLPGQETYYPYSYALLVKIDCLFAFAKVYQDLTSLGFCLLHWEGIVLLLMK